MQGKNIDVFSRILIESNAECASTAQETVLLTDFETNVFLLLNYWSNYEKRKSTANAADLATPPCKFFVHARAFVQ